MKKNKNSSSKFFKIIDICEIIKGKFPTLKTKPGSYPFVVTAQERKTADKFQLTGPAVCIPLVSSTGHGHAAIHRIHYQEGKFALANLLVALKPKDQNFCNPKYLFHLLMSKKDEYFVSLMRGTANVTLKKEELAEVEIPIPPIEKQIRIVSFLEKFYSKNDECRKSLEISYNYLSAFNQNLLKFAITGNLSRKWRNENKNKQKIYTLKKSEKSDNDSKSKKKFEYFELPEDWICTKIDNICNVKGRIGWRGYTKKDLVDDGPLVIGAKHLSDDWKIDLTNPVRISRVKYEESPEIKVNLNDLIIAQRGSIGKMAIVDYEIGDATINPNVLLVKEINLINKFLLFILASPKFQNILLESNSTTSIPMITQESLKNLIIPIPPIDEQKFIVEQIEKNLVMVNNSKNLVSENISETKNLRKHVTNSLFL